MKRWAKRFFLGLSLLLSFVLGYDFALTRLANDMLLGRTSLKDNRLRMEIQCRRILYESHCGPEFVKMGP